MRALVSAAAVLLAMAAAPLAAQAPDTKVPAEVATATTAVARAGCVRCHTVPAALQERLQPRRGPALALAAAFHQDDGGQALLQQHPGGGAAAADLAAWVRSLAKSDPVPAPADSSAAAIARGEQLMHELACAACHAPAQFAGLPTRVDHGRLAAFLQAPTTRYPDLLHPPLDADEATAVAAWLLRTQQLQEQPMPGFAWQCFERKIQGAGEPDLTKLKPSASGHAERIDATPGTRANNFVLRFTASITVPTAGEWTFTAGSDDSSWLWIDDQLVVRNEALAPHRRESGKVQLTAGPHALRVLYTQAGGGASLEVLWQGPGTDEQPLPASVASAARTVLAPPKPLPMPAADAVSRGRAVARAQRCDACHAFDDAQFAALPAPTAAKAWHELREAACPQVPGAQALFGMARTAVALPPSASLDLEVALQRDGCLACHTRDGRGGLQPAVRQQLREIEDIGEEGRSPPDLTAAGHRLRPQWIERVLRGEVRARPYLRVRMPVLSEAAAKAFAARFHAVDARAGDDVEPAFSVDAVQRGRELAGTSGKNCITCHVTAGHRSLGPQGMDLAQLHERTKPVWFREWLQTPTVHRPGTRMPGLWPLVNERSLAEMDALRTWMSLGNAAPLPRGLKLDGAMQLEAIDGPRLHGAFLKEVSARCLAVATPERTHFAYDLADPRLVWIWRGAFVDPAATWNGRAGQLVSPKGTDWIVVPAVDAVGGARQLLGQRRTKDGYPVLRVQIGADAEYEDEARARLVPGGSEIVRTLRVVRGRCEFLFATAKAPLRIEIAGAAADRVTLAAGEHVEVVYRW